MIDPAPSVPLAMNDIRAMQLGHAVQLLFNTPRRGFSIASAYLWLWPAIRLGQIAWTSSVSGAWTGFATWAYLSDDADKVFASDDPPYLHVSDWNEGAHLWIMDFVAPNNNAVALSRKLKDALSPRFSTARHVVRRPDGRVSKVKTLRWERGA